MLDLQRKRQKKHTQNVEHDMQLIEDLETISKGTGFQDLI